jgi:hypothetical protein
MKNAVAILGGIHSNYEALTFVLDHVKAQEVSRVVCLGDNK